MGQHLKESEGAEQQLKTNGSANHVIETGDFRIDLATRKVSVRDHEMELTSEEFEVLVYLIGHPKSFATPHTTLATRWTTDSVQHADFIEVLFSLSRKLISEGQHYIRTEPWILYRFDPSASTTH